MKTQTISALVALASSVPLATATVRVSIYIQPYYTDTLNSLAGPAPLNSLALPTPIINVTANKVPGSIGHHLILGTSAAMAASTSAASLVPAPSAVLPSVITSLAVPSRYFTISVYSLDHSNNSRTNVSLVKLPRTFQAHQASAAALEEMLTSSLSTTSKFPLNSIAISSSTTTCLMDLLASKSHPARRAAQQSRIHSAVVQRTSL
jgi:hypothetical protein